MVWLIIIIDEPFNHLYQGKTIDLFAMICVIHEILEATASPNNISFVRAFGNKAKNIFSEVSRYKNQ